MNEETSFKALFCVCIYFSLSDEFPSLRILFAFQGFRRIPGNVSDGGYPSLPFFAFTIMKTSLAGFLWVSLFVMTACRGHCDGFTPENQPFVRKNSNSFLQKNKIKSELSLSTRGRLKTRRYPAIYLPDWKYKQIHLEAFSLKFSLNIDSKIKNKSKASDRARFIFFLRFFYVIIYPIGAK